MMGNQERPHGYAPRGRAAGTTIEEAAESVFSTPRSISYRLIELFQIIMGPFPEKAKVVNSKCLPMLYKRCFPLDVTGFVCITAVYLYYVVLLRINMFAVCQGFR
jgi:hypothetical protein